jgi:1,4-dihydroxy-2-naphthoate octaprenyltransferase
VFVLGVINSGKVLYGILALVGLIFAHLGANVIDDYFDYKHLIKQVDFDKDEYLKSSQKTKCRYLINGIFKESDILRMTICYFALAFLVGLFLFFKCGMGVFYFALLGGIIALIYPFASRIYLSEIAIALAYGPLLFGGVYYVMTGQYSTEIIWLSLPTMMMTVVLLYIHTIMDYEYDLDEGKHTIANTFCSQLESLLLLKILLTLSYISVLILCVLDIVNWQVFFVYLSIPLAIDLYNSMVEYTCNPDLVPTKKWYHFPMERMAVIKQRGDESFMIRMYQGRNLMIYFSLLLAFGIICSLAL